MRCFGSSLFFSCRFVSSVRRALTSITVASIPLLSHPNLLTRALVGFRALTQARLHPYPIIVVRLPRANQRQSVVPYRSVSPFRSA